MRPVLITENYNDDLNCVEMDNIEHFNDVRLLLTQHELVVDIEPSKNYPYRTMDVFDDIPF